MRTRILFIVLIGLVIFAGCFHDPPPFVASSNSLAGSYSITQFYAVDSSGRIYNFYDSLPLCQKNADIILLNDMSYQLVEPAGCNVVVPFAANGNWTIKNGGTIISIDGKEHEISVADHTGISFWFTGIIQGKPADFFEALSRQ